MDTDKRPLAEQQLLDAIERLLTVGHKVWEPHQHDSEWDEMSAALTALYMARGFAVRTGLLSENAR